MDLLKAEIARKRKSVALAKNSTKVKKLNSNAKYFKASDLRRFEEEEYQSKEENRINASTQKQEITLKVDNQLNDDALSTLCQSNNKSNQKQYKTKEKDLNTKQNTKSKLTPNELSLKLRSIGAPIRLFGEQTIPIKNSPFFNDSQREIRLNQALTNLQNKLVGKSEMDDFRLGSGHGIRNTFLNDDNNRNEEKSVVVNNANGKLAQFSEPQHVVKNEENKTTHDDPHKHIYNFFKSLLKQWETDLIMRSEAEKCTAVGKNNTKTLKQCRDYIRPLFKLCKTRRLEPFLLNKIYEIVIFCQENEFVKANNVYNDVAIGRAAWPIGVTMVGIHARSGRARIESGNVAHVMNSELQRKYLTSVKRLMTYCQNKQKNVAPSKKVMN